MEFVTDPETEFEIVGSESPVSVDGYALGEPKFLRCLDCGADVLLTPEPSPGVDELGHHPRCRQRGARTRKWWELVMGVDPKALEGVVRVADVEE